MNLKISNIDLNIPKENKFVSPEVYVNENNSLPYYEPARMFRYMMSYSTEEGSYEWYVNNLSRPAIRMERSDNGYLIRQTWSSINISLRVLIGVPPNNPNRDLFNWFTNGIKRDIIIDKLDPTGVVAERWILHNCLLTSIPMSMGEEDDWDLEVLPDYCTLSI